MAEEKSFSLLDPFSTVDIGLEDSGDTIKQWAIENRGSIQPFKIALNDLIVQIESLFLAIPPTIMIMIFALIAWQTAGRRTAIIVIVAMFVLGFLSPQIWALSMTTIAIVVSAVVLCVIIGLPLGILAGKSDVFQMILRPVLDTMQTIPAFVYLVPVVMLIGIGNVSGVLVTIVFALPPLIRLTSLGIRGVDASVVEAARAFGASPRQILMKVEFPLAIPTIMAGLNQTIMLSLSMVVIASMISVKGLGNEVLRAMGRLDSGKAIVSGLGIVILAVVLDRITQGLGKTGRNKDHRHWWQGGPVGAVLRLTGANRTSKFRKQGDTQ